MGQIGQPYSPGGVGVKGAFSSCKIENLGGMRLSEMV